MCLQWSQYLPVERDGEKSCTGANSEIGTKQKVLQTSRWNKYHLTINVRFFFTVLLCHPGFSMKCVSLHHWHSTLMRYYLERSLSFDWSQFYSVPGPPCDTEENVQVRWLPKSTTKRKATKKQKKPHTPKHQREGRDGKCKPWDFKLYFDAGTRTPWVMAISLLHCQ